MQPKKQVPYTVHAQHKARKEAEYKLRAANGKIAHLKNTVGILLKKLKSVAGDEQKRADEQVAKIRKEMIWHEKRSLSEISRLTSIVDGMGSDPDIVSKITQSQSLPKLSHVTQTDISAMVGNKQFPSLLGESGDNTMDNHGGLTAPSTEPVRQIDRRLSTSLSFLAGKHNTSSRDKPYNEEYTNPRVPDPQNHGVLSSMQQLPKIDTIRDDVATEKSLFHARAISKKKHPRRGVKIAFEPSPTLKRIELVGDTVVSEISTGTQKKIASKREMRRAELRKRYL